MRLLVKRTEFLDVIPSIDPLLDCLGGLVQSCWW
jgi:hypothetical protein